MSRKLVSIDNFNPDAAVIRFNSPRTLEACRRKGIIFEELARPDYNAIEMEVKQI